MKLNTDGVLLGAWVDMEGVNNAVDVGTGCGIIALMMAQRSEKARIDAIDIHEGSITDAGLNFSNSPWSERLKACHCALHDFARITQPGYDLIVSNPPYFCNSLKSADHTKNLSRHDTGLSLAAFFPEAKKILKPGGKLALIYPYDGRDRLEELAWNNHLHINKELRVCSVRGNAPVRLLLELSGSKGKSCTSETLSIRDEQHQYTSGYMELTRDFYLAF